MNIKMILINIINIHKQALTLSSPFNGQQKAMSVMFMIKTAITCRLKVPRFGNRNYIIAFENITKP